MSLHHYHLPDEPVLNLVSIIIISIAHQVQNSDISFTLIGGWDLRVTLVGL